MKFLLVALIFTLGYCQETRPDLSVTDDLLAAQEQLTIGHEFSEVFLVENRQRLSDYVERIERFALDHFLNSYAEIRGIADETEELMNAFVEPSVCKDTIRARWALQVARYGQMISRCLASTNR